MITLDGLCSLAFEQGCGTSRTAALGSPRYNELKKAPFKMRYAGKRRTAELMLLGEHLADRAFENLPEALQHAAYGWKKMTWRQQQICAKQLLAVLSPAVWRESRGRETSEVAIESVLPQQCGSWQDGPHRPNCLGVAQMLVGFARRSGASHYLASTIEMADGQIQSMGYELYDTVQRVLERAVFLPAVKKRQAMYRRDQARMLKSLARFQQSNAHHALVIMSRKGWLLIDPYMRTYYLLDHLRGKANEISILRKRPDVVMNVTDREAPLPEDHTRALVGLSAAVISAQTYLRQPDDPDGLRQAVSRTAMMGTLGLHMFASQEATWERIVSLGLDELCDKRGRYLLVRALLPPRHIGRYMDANTEEQNDIVNRYLRLAERSARFRRACITRLVLAASDYCVIWYDDAIQGKGGLRHPAIEIGHPTYMLGLATILHTAFAKDVPLPELVAYSGSQWVTHDTLDAVRAIGTTRHRRIADARLRQLAKVNKHSVLAGLRPYIERKPREQRQVDPGDAGRGSA